MIRPWGQAVKPPWPPWPVQGRELWDQIDEELLGHWEKPLGRPGYDTFTNKTGQGLTVQQTPGIQPLK